MKTSLALVNELEGLFVREFRSCQAIHALTLEERQALFTGQVASLPGLTAQIGSLLDSAAGPTRLKPSSGSEVCTEKWR